MTMYVTLDPCVKHLPTTKKRAPACFHNLGGAYEVVRELVWGMVLLRHGKSDSVGLAEERELHIAPQG